jgi:hypothetical protein
MGMIGTITHIAAKKSRRLLILPNITISQNEPIA